MPTPNALMPYGKRTRCRRPEGMPPAARFSTGRAVHLPDVREDPEYTLDLLRDAVGLRSLLSVPMLRDGIPIGTITVQGGGRPGRSPTSRSSC